MLVSVEMCFELLKHLTLNLCIVAYSKLSLIPVFDRPKLESAIHRSLVSLISRARGNGETCLKRSLNICTTHETKTFSLFVLNHI